jgi:hypothetical protein
MKKKGGHPHKGAKTKREQLKKVPIVYMSDEERRQTFAGLSRMPEMVEDARLGIGDDDIVVALVLRGANGARRLLIADFEHGDGCGHGFIVHEIDTIKRTKALKPGETTEIVAARLSLDDSGGLVLTPVPVEDLPEPEVEEAED